MLALIDAKESWHPTSNKYKTPRDFVISSLRLLNVDNIDTPYLRRALTNLGQQPFKAGSPAGFGDTKEHWNGANALMTRIDWAAQLAGSKYFNNLSAIESTLKSQLSLASYTQVMRAESRQQSVTLALMSPEFQRR